MLTVNSELECEREVLKEKRKLIKKELEIKNDNLKNAFEKYKALSKEAKGSYSEEKETSEKIYNVLLKDIRKYESAIDEPYFGRIDFREYMGDEESVYIGKKGINSSKDGEEIVVDWRAPIADLYYSGTGGKVYYKAPKGIIEGELNLKRKFLYDNNHNLDRIFDEGINEIILNNEEGLVDEFLKINLEENTGKKLKEVVATIQKEQNDIIRWPKNIPLIVQGSAGSGKTTIALHRLAYLLYRYREAIKGEEILVLAPNKLFLNYISDILPNLGADKVNQSTFEELILKKLKLRGKIYNKDQKLANIIEEKDQNRKNLMVRSSKMRGTLTFKSIIDRYIVLLEGTSLEIEDIKVEGYCLFSKKEIMRLYFNDLKYYPINKRKDEIKKHLNGKLKNKMENILILIDQKWNSQIVSVKKEMEDSKERREKLIEVYEARDKIKDSIKKNAKKVFNDYFKNWRGINSKDIYYDFFNNKEAFFLAADKEIPEDLYEFMKDEYNYNCENNIIDEDDMPALAHIRNLLEGIEEKEKFKHIVVDEAQDYSPFQVFLVSEFSTNNSLTLVGDLAQGIYYYKGLKKWDDITEKLFLGKGTFKELSQSYRSTVEIIEFADKVLKAQNVGLISAKPVLRHGNKPKILKASCKNEYISLIELIIKKVHDLGKSTIAIITKDLETAKVLNKFLKRKIKYKYTLVSGKEKMIDSDIIIIPSYLTKGLEFDCTIIFNPTDKYYSDNILDKRLLYVSLTRALHEEYIIYDENFSITQFI